MKWRKTEKGYILRLEEGDEVISSLSQLARQQGIKGGTFWGLGAVEESVIGYYDSEAKKYEKKSIPQSQELVGLQGTISWLEGEPFVHAHAVLAGDDFRAYGGHLFSAKVSATVELWVHILKEELKRFHEPHQKMNLLEI